MSRFVDVFIYKQTNFVYLAEIASTKDRLLSDLWPYRWGILPSLCIRGSFPRWSRRTAVRLRRRLRAPRADASTDRRSDSNTTPPTTSVILAQWISEHILGNFLDSAKKVTKNRMFPKQGPDGALYTIIKFRVWETPPKWQRYYKLTAIFCATFYSKRKFI